METKDHYYLSKELAKALGLKKFKSIIFILGNLIPDINPFSYITSTSDNRFSGHSYSCRKGFINQILEKRCTDTPIWWYRTGKMIHYLADSFTRPHNEEFQYSLQDHVEYEHQLHGMLISRLNQHPSPNLTGRVSTADFSAKQLEKEHEIYMKESHGLDEDCHYILQTTCTALQALTVSIHKRAGITCAVHHACQSVSTPALHAAAVK